MPVASSIDGQGLPTRVRLLVHGLLLVTVLCWPVQAAAQPGTSVLLTLNQGIHSPGTTIEVGLGLHHAGPPIPVDLFFGLLLPDGETTVSFEGPGAPRAGRVSDLRTLRPLVSGLTVGAVDVVVPSFFRYAFQGHEPLGAYKFFFAAMRAGALNDGRLDGGDVLAVRLTDVLLAPQATVTVDAPRTATATVPLTGGTVTATAADGTVYTLTVPRGALAAPTAISLTPVTAMTSPLAGLRNVRAVQAAPEGLALRLPATLTIRPAGALPAGLTVGVSTTGSGGGFDELPAGRAGNGTVSIGDITHFSVLGAAFPATAEEVVDLYTYGAEGPYKSRAVAAEQAGDAAGIVRAMADWHADLIAPQLAASSTDEFALLDAMGAYFSWEVSRHIGYGGLSVLDPTAFQSKTLLADALRAALARRLSTCQAEPSLVNAEIVMRLQNVAREYFDVLQFVNLVPDFIPAPLPLHGDLHELDLASVLARLCVRAEIVSTTFPATMQPGVAAPLTVRAGLVLGTAPVSFTRALQVAVTATGVTPTQRTGTTDATGHFQTSFTPTGNSATLDILAALVDGEFPFLGLAPLSVTTRLVRTGGGVVVTPSQTTIAPGASRQFTANQTVTWAVNGGGSITSSGLFTSNGTPGTFFVTATSVADPSEVGVAQVTVSGAGVLTSLTFRASTALTAATCTTPVNLPLQPAPLNGSASCTIPAPSGPINIATGQLGVVASTTNAAWTLTSNVTPDFDGQHSVNGTSAYTKTITSAGTVNLSVATAGFTGGYIAVLQASYNSQTFQARYALSPTGQVTINEPTASFAVVPSGNPTLTITLTVTCTGGCAGSGVVATAVVP